VSDAKQGQVSEAGRRQGRRLAITLGVLAVAIYVGFILMTVLRAGH